MTKPIFLTTMKISRNTLNDLTEIGKMGDTYEDVVKKLIKWRKQRLG